jgi:hypothetical protein
MVGKSVDVLVRRTVGFSEVLGVGAAGVPRVLREEEPKKGMWHNREERNGGRRVLRCMLSGRSTLFECVRYLQC